MRRVVLPILLTLAACSGGDAGSDPYPSRMPLPEAPARDAGVRVVDAEEACLMQSTQATRGVDKAVDIIFVIDNSGSMGDEIAAVRSNINTNFARIIDESGVDYQVILLTRFGTESTQVCIEPPLASDDCWAGVWGAQSDVLFHYDVEIQSHDAFCRILDTFDRPDPAQLAPDGWGALLRAEAEKVFVVISDDSANCTHGDGESAVVFGHGDFGVEPTTDPYADALLFHRTLLARSPENFGVPPDIKYRFYSIVGMEAGAAQEPYFPHQDLVMGRCDTAATSGLSYQALSVVTDSLRYPVCEGRGFDALFQVLARGVVESAKADCIFEIPEDPIGEGILLDTINVEYIPGRGGDVRRFRRTDEPATCDDSHFLIRDERIELCPEACEVVEADRDAEVNVHYQCLPSPD